MWQQQFANLPAFCAASPAASPCTWPLLCSDHRDTPQVLSAPPKPGLLLRPWPAPAGGHCGQAPRTPTWVQSAVRRTVSWGCGGGVGRGSSLSSGRGIPRFYTAPVLPPKTQGQFGGTAGREPWRFTAGVWVLPAGGLYAAGKRRGQQKASGEQAVGSFVTLGLDLAPAQDSE